jgi:apolipoprotein D and lipocalin family protein
MIAKRWLTALATLLLGGCIALPEGIEPVVDFKLQNYLGTWYEIARLDHSFERGLEQVTATYSLQEDGGVSVVNRGFKREAGEWKEATGRAYFVGEPSVGRLKVSFFGPFYGGYNIIALDHENYQWAMICGPSRKYLWILARQPQISEDIITKLLDQAKSANFPLEGLIRVHQGKPSKQ